MVNASDVTWTCRFHPTDWFHEVGCPHQEWTMEQVLGALIEKKRFEQQRYQDFAKQFTQTGQAVSVQYPGMTVFNSTPPVVLSSGQAEINAAIASWSQEDKEAHAKVFGRRTET